MQTETTVETTAIDTNVEYIQTQNEVKEPPVISTVFKAIVVETVKDFFGSIIGFFLRYIKHFIDCVRYFWSPTLHRKPFDKKDYKEHCQHSFEFALIILFVIIFMVKLELIPETSEAMLKIYNNDLGQMAVQFLYFVAFAILYIVAVLFSVFSGRLFRMMFKVQIKRRESDILMIYLNNALYSFTAIIALWARSTTSFETGDEDFIIDALVNLVLGLFFVLTLLWSIRYVILNKLKPLKAVMFVILATIIYSFFFGLACSIVAQQMIYI